MRVCIRVCTRKCVFILASPSHVRILLFPSHSPTIGLIGKSKYTVCVCVCVCVRVCVFRRQHNPMNPVESQYVLCFTLQPLSPALLISVFLPSPLVLFLSLSLSFGIHTMMLCESVCVCVLCVYVYVCVCYLKRQQSI